MQKYVLEGGKRRRAEEVNCRVCNKVFLRRDKVAARKTKQIFCSRECRWSKSNKIDVVCSVCNKGLRRNPSKIQSKIFCSKHCKDSAAKRTTSCLNCSVEINHKSKYCSADCYQQFKNRRLIESWLNGTWNARTGKFGEELSHTIRNYLLNKANYSCSKCTWNSINPKTGNSPLTINHKDGNPLNNDRSNLEVLCPNCHSLTPNYGSLNLGNGRKKRRKENISGPLAHSGERLVCNQKATGAEPVRSTKL